MPTTMQLPPDERHPDRLTSRADPFGAASALPAVPPEAVVPRSATPEDDDYEAFGRADSRDRLQARLEIPLMLWMLQLPLGARVLEVGCGRGVALPELSARMRPRALVGVDLDADALAIAERRVRGAGTCATLLRADVRDLPFERASFDVVIDFGTCYHVGGGIGGQLAAMREVARVLAPGGLFVHETPVAQHLAHPVRSFGRTLPWLAEPALVRDRAAVLWAARRRRADGRA